MDFIMTIRFNRPNETKLEEKLTTEESNFYQSIARSYLYYFGNKHPTLKQLATMQDLLASHWLKRTIRFAYQLTSRECECLYYLMSGKNKKEIAGLMQISPETVKAHIRSILKKLQCKNIKEAIPKAIRYELIKQRYYFCFE
jgi:DNA-binding CsgD family transcriptional regulator